MQQRCSKALTLSFFFFFEWEGKGISLKEAGKHFYFGLWRNITTSKTSLSHLDLRAGSGSFVVGKAVKLFSWENCFQEAVGTTSILWSPMEHYSASLYHPPHGWLCFHDMFRLVSAGRWGNNSPCGIYWLVSNVTKSSYLSQWCFSQVSWVSRSTITLPGINDNFPFFRLYF